MCFRILHPIIEIAKRIVSCTCQIAGERKSRIVCGIRHFFISTNTFLRHQVRISTAETCRTIFVMNIYHQIIFSTFTNCIMQPGTPTLITYLYKTELDTFQSPFFIQRQQNIQLLH